MAEQVKDLVLSLLWLRSLLWCRFDLWPGNFWMPWVQLKKKKNKHRTDYVPDAVLSALYMVTHLVLIITVWGKSYYSCFTEQDPEAHTGYLPRYIQQISDRVTISGVEHHPTLCSRMPSAPFCIQPTCRYCLSLVQNQSPEGAQWSLNSQNPRLLPFICSFFMLPCFVLLGMSMYVIFPWGPPRKGRVV